MSKKCIKSSKDLRCNSGKEYFFGGSGIQWCGPGGTVMGQPGSVEDLGETDIPESVFQDYLRTQGGNRFSGDKYDLFHHNCNNFSNETAQFLVGRGIPQHILDLPGEILRTPMGQMLAPMLQQMTPTGTSIPFTDNMPGTQTSKYYKNRVIFMEDRIP